MRPLFRQPPQWGRAETSNTNENTISQAALPWLPGDKPSGRKPSVKSIVLPARCHQERGPERIFSTYKTTIWWIDFGTMWSKF
ncbi:MAG: hypothetical protein C0507_25600 [Cyanobacteria bacterium PR.3.49]|nr:hypothetical protein [Cyanobacteria bacterium PR.3.49]